MTRAALLATCLAAAAGCTYAVNDVFFRTHEADGAFARAVEAVKTHCHGVKLADPERLLIYSAWQAWPTSEGTVLSRCLVTLSPRPEDKAHEVRVAFAMKECPLADLDDLEALAEKCAFTTAVADIVAAQLNLSAKAIEEAVRR